MAELKDWLNSINFTKDNLVEEDPNAIKDYPPYIITVSYTHLTLPTNREV